MNPITSPNTLPLLYRRIDRHFALQVSRIVAIPCFHAAAVPATHVSALRGGQVNYIMRRFDLVQFLEGCEKYKVTEITTVPPMAVGIVKSPLSKRPYLKATRAGSVGAAPLDKDVQAQFRSLLGPDATYNQVWGMTESSCIATKFSYPENDNTGSVGRPIPNLGMKYVHASNHCLPWELHTNESQP